MNLEEELRKLITDKFGSIRQFSIEIDLPYTTVLSILDRGVMNAKVLNVLKMCETLGIDPEALGDNKIIFVKNSSNIMKIYERLSKPRKNKVYSFAEHQLHEQNNTVDEQSTVYLVGQTAAGEPLEYGQLQPEQISVDVPKGADRALNVKGDSMEPLIKDGSIVFYKDQPTVENGEIAIVEIDGSEVTCKKFYFDGEKVILRSINDKYEDMIFDGGVRIIGKVILN